MNSIKTAPNSTKGLTNSVGPGKPNSSDDVRIVQSLLNQNIGKIIPTAPLAEDGRFGPRTQNAIVQFQSRVVHSPTPDGIVDPRGPTLRALLGNSAPQQAPPNVARFIQMALPAARTVKARWGVPIAVTIAQSALETGWGSAVVNNAYFGIKGRAPSGASSNFGTTEVIDGKVIHINANFRAYNDYADAADDYGRFLNENKRYAPAFAFKNDSARFVEMIARAGYATDPNYAKSLKHIISSNQLDRYDQ